MDAHKNAAYSLVATAPSPAASGTSLVVTAGEGARFPAVPFNATVWASGAQPNYAAGGATGGNFEIVRVTARSTDTLTITRAQESSTARTIVVGDQIAATITAKVLTDIETAIPTVLPNQNFATGMLVPPFIASGTGIGIANRALLIRFLCLSSMTITKMSFCTTVAAGSNDNCDVGIFSGDGTTLLGSSGSTAGKLNATAGVQTVPLTSSVALVAGTVYYAAFVCGTVGSTAATLSAQSVSTNAADIMGATLPNRSQSFQASAFPLAAPHTTGGSPANAPILGLLL